MDLLQTRPASVSICLFFFTFLQWNKPSKYSCFVLLRFNVLVNIFSNVGTEPPLPWYLLLLWGVNVPCSSTQHDATSGDGTQDLLIQVNVPC